MRLFLFFHCSRRFKCFTASHRGAIRTRFFLPLFRHYCVKSLANTKVLASFLPCIAIKIVWKKFNEPETDEILSRFWCEGRRKACRLSRTTNRKMPEFRCFRRVRITLRWLAIGDSNYRKSLPLWEGKVPRHEADEVVNSGVIVFWFQKWFWKFHNNIL